jgi:hypothetical protein
MFEMSMRDIAKAVSLGVPCGILGSIITVLMFVF